MTESTRVTMDRHGTYIEPRQGPRWFWLRIVLTIVGIATLGVGLHMAGNAESNHWLIAAIATIAALGVIVAIILLSESKIFAKRPGIRLIAVIAAVLATIELVIMLTWIWEYAGHRLGFLDGTPFGNLIVSLLL